MADISKIVLGSTTYNIKDTVARAAIAGGMHFLGVSLSEITDASSSVAIIKTGTNTANRYYTGTAPTGTSGTYSGTTYTLKNVALTAGDVVIYSRYEFVFSTSDNCWHELGSTGSLGTLAYNNNVTVKYDKATSASFTGTPATITGTVTQGSVSASGSTSGVAVASHSYKPAGTITNGTPGTTTVIRSVNTSKLATTTVHDTPTISAPTNTVKASTTSLRGVAGTTTAVNASYANETLTLSAVTAATANAASTTVATGLTGTTTFVTSATLTAGTSKTVATGSVSSDGTGSDIVTSVPSDGYADAITSLGTPTFTGTTATIAHTVTQGTVSVTGTTSGVKVTSTYTPEGSVTITNTETTVTATASK